MNFRVKLVPSPTVVNADGTSVTDARVLEISFPGETIETRLGKVNAISGAGVAKIIVAGGTLRGVRCAETAAHPVAVDTDPMRVVGSGGDKRRASASRC